MVDDLDELLRSPDFARATRQVRESVLRKFVAAHPAISRGWMELLRVLSVNESWREHARLAAEAARRFPAEPALPVLAAAGLAHLLEIGPALATIAQAGALLHGFAPAHHLAGDLLLVSNPAHAASVFNRVLAGSPNDSRSQIGAASAASLLNGRNGAEVVFLLTAAWHRSIQEGVFGELTSQGIGCVMSPEVWLIPALRPKVVVVSDVPQDVIRRIRYTVPTAKIVNTRHGLGDKNYAYHASTIVDYVCASSEHVAREQIRAGWIDPAAVWVTGFPQMDSVFRGIGHSAAGRTGAAAHIVLAPTFTKGLNCGELIGDDPVAAIRGGRSEWRVTVRPHPHMRSTHQRLLDAWQRSITASVNAAIDMDFDRSPTELLGSADLLVSDVSSVALQFLALDRPIVCLMQDEVAVKSPFFAPESFEVRLSRAAVKVARKEELGEAVRRSLERGQPDAIVAERRALATLLFGDLRDGRAAIRVARKIRELVDGAAR